ncbi:hypothetical protein C0V70_12800 [Bacteriovorax stolpii]|uniref:Uncharacterized protein n=1 Tax=Bacteriovorax stolpii TaxID=960 RepID=A0A2K9NTW7_BACTC|nr:hypothetical protein [Bacteriovorax stolpii]AUN98963.1 hypothetical protein C0V70_12800 [Bacteriovorax stolpii]TDP55514.1 hypothetical protein C8D79_0564 [Bacteriovorax stolpii]
MKKLMLVLLTSLALTTSLFAKDGVPRQKINLLGELLPSAPKAISVKDMEAFKKPESVTIFDPYNKNIKTVFYGFYLHELVKAYAKPDFKTLKVVAIDGYKVDIPKADITSANLFMSYKDDKGYLTVDRMGPGRIIAPVDGIINKDLLLKIGIYWVWQVKSLEFSKK